MLTTALIACMTQTNATSMAHILCPQVPVAVAHCGTEVRVLRMSSVTEAMLSQGLMLCVLGACGGGMLCARSQGTASAGGNRLGAHA